MLKINNKPSKVLSSKLKFINSTIGVNPNIQKGYTILVSLDIELNNKEGYISFYIDFLTNNTPKQIENKKYTNIPETNSKINMIEIFDTKDFIDYIDGPITIEFGKINNNQIETTINIKDEEITVQYQGPLNIEQN